MINFVNFKFFWVMFNSYVSYYQRVIHDFQAHHQNSRDGLLAFGSLHL